MGFVLRIKGPKLSTLAREYRSTEAPSWQPRRRQRRRNTNRQRDDTSHIRRVFTGLSREAPPERPFALALLVGVSILDPVVQAAREIVRFLPAACVTISRVTWRAA